jgi:hypothetical protein
MTIAAEILATARNADAAMRAAEELDPIPDQDWEAETTTYRFADGSRLIVSGPQVNAEA